MLLSFTNFKDMTVFLHAYQFTIRTFTHSFRFRCYFFVLFCPCYFLAFFLFSLTTKNSYLYTSEWQLLFVNQIIICNTKNTFCRTRSLSDAIFFIFDHVTFIQFKICCCVQNFIKIGWFFAEIWRYNDFQNGAVRHHDCYTTVRDHPWSLCCWPQLPVKFHVNLIHRSENIAVWIVRIFGLKCLFWRPKWGFWGTSDPKCHYASSRPPKGTSLRKSASV